MSSKPWVSEKSGSLLYFASSLSEKLQVLKISEEEREDVARCLYHIIDYGASIKTFACDNDDCLKHPWVELMLEEGVERYEEFNAQASGLVSNEVPPKEWPSSLQRVVDAAAAMKEASRDVDLGRTMARETALECARALRATTAKKLCQLAESLEELVDQQTYHNNISWPDFLLGMETASQDVLGGLEEYRREKYRSWSRE